MCLSPITIKNPNYGLKNIGYNYLRNCSTTHIGVPCGHCAECIAVAQMEMIQRIQMEAMFNHLFFGTLTYNEESLPIMEVNGYKIKYADYSHWQKMIERIRHKISRPFRYIVVSEFGSQKGRPHFHFILSLPKYETDTQVDITYLDQELYSLFMEEWRTNKGSRRNPEYHRLFTWNHSFKNGKITYNYDLHYLNPKLSDGGVADVGYYVLKYMMKKSDREIKLQQALKLNLDPDEYKKVWNKVRTIRHTSLGFGLIRQDAFQDAQNKREIKKEYFCQEVVDHIRQGIKFARENNFEYPVFIHPDTGKTYPLSKFYRNLFLSMEDSIYFFEKRGQLGTRIGDDGLLVSDPEPLNNIMTKISEYQERCRILDEKSFY